MIDPAERERAVLELLDKWPWEHGGAIIGGYAVAAYGAPRYSDDLDIVLSIDAYRKVFGWLLSEGFEETSVPIDLTQNYAGKVSRLCRGNITIDLLPGVVRDREAQVDIPEDWLTTDVHRVRLILLDGATRNPVPVVRLEALWALKLQAGRMRDLGDLFAIHEAATDAGQVRALYQALWSPTMATKLHRVNSRLEDEKIYRDTLSIRGRGSPRHARNLKSWERFKMKVRAMLPLAEWGGGRGGGAGGGVVRGPPY